MKNRLLSLSIFVAAILILFSTKANAQYDIFTIAGNGTAGATGDGGLATAAEMSSVFGITLDAAGNIYVVDNGNNKVRKITKSTGVITTIAGNGTAGFSGDGADATAAELSNPVGVAVDGSGNVYIADNTNARIRMINTAGTISTIAGTGTAGYNGDGIAATAAEIKAPYQIALDNAGNIYFDDGGNSRIRMINTNGIISTYAGNGTSGYNGDGDTATLAELDGPNGLAIDDSNNVYIVVATTNHIRKVNTNHIITTIAGNGTAGFSGDGGPATAAEMNYPNQIAVDDTGNVFFSDRSNDRIREIRKSTGYISSPVGVGTFGYSGDNGPATAAKMSLPPGVTVGNDGTIYVADWTNYRVRACCVKPATPGTISGNATVCKGSSETYYITPVAGAESYTWTVPSGFTGSSTTDSITIVAGGFNPTNTLTVTANRCTSSAAQSLTINMKIPLTFTAQPSTTPQTGCPGFTATALSVGPISGVYTYQWYSNTVNSNSGGAAIGGATTYKYTPVTTSPGTLYYYCDIDYGCVNTSNVSGAISVDTLPTFSVQPSSAPQSGCSGSATVSVSAAGSGLSYQWYSNTSAANTGGTLLSGATANTYTPTDTGALYYYCTISGSCTPATTSVVSGLVAVLAPSTSTITQSGCDSIKINGQKFTTGGTFMQHLTNKAGCDSVITLNITITNSTSSTITQSGCDGLGVNGQFYNATGTYYQHVTNAAGCDSAITLNLTITHIDSTITEAGNVLTATTSGIAYKWVQCGAGFVSLGSNQSFTAPGNGYYAVILYENGCSDSSQCVDVLTTGIAENNATESGVVLYPSPSNGHLTMLFNGTGYQAITIYSETGKAVFTQMLNASDAGKQLNIDLSMYADGMYFAKVITTGGVLNKKLLIQK